MKSDTPTWLIGIEPVQPPRISLPANRVGRNVRMWGKGMVEKRHAGSADSRAVRRPWAAFGVEAHPNHRLNLVAARRAPAAL